MRPSAVMTIDPKMSHVVEAGRERGLEVAPRTFPAETRTAEDAARAVGCETSQIVKSLIFGSDRGPVLFLVSGTNRLDPARGAAAVGASSLDRLDATRAKDVTGFSIGATPPFGLRDDLPVVMDEALLRHEVVWASAGRTDSVFPTAPRELARATGATITTLRVD